MKKKYTIVFINLLLSFLILKAQEHSKLLSNPSAYQTGVPEISYPLFQISAAKNFELSLGISYNPNTYTFKGMNGGLGRNWNIVGSIYSISKINSSSEKDPNSNTHYPYDVYAYNINGEEGYFKLLFKKDNSNYINVILTMLTNSKTKITFEIDGVSAPNRKSIKSFTLIDNNGNKYFFNKYNSSYEKYGTIGNYEHRDQFQITSIKDVTNRDIISYSYKQITIPNSTVSPKINLIEEIKTTSAKIHFVYETQTTFEDLDKERIKFIQLYDQNNKIHYYYELTHLYQSVKLYDLFNMFTDYESKHVPTRYLVSLAKKDKNSQLIEQTKFEYDFNPKNTNNNISIWWGQPNHKWIGAIRYDNPKKLLYGVLKSIYLPTGGKIDYEFEPNKLESFENKNSQDYINKIKDPFQFTDPELEYIDSKYYDGESTDYIDFDTKISRKYYINNLKNTDPYVRIYIQFQISEKYPIDNGNSPIETFGPFDPQPFVKYKVKGALNTNFNFEYDDYLNGNYYIIPNNGSAYIEITGGGNGYIYILEKMYTQPPYQNEVTSAYSGVRVKNIKYYDKKNGSSYGQPLKFSEFEYNYFDRPNISSGIGVPDLGSESIIYKNVKVYDSDKKGYTKYHYKTPYDIEKIVYPENPNRLLMPHYEQYKKGVLYKEEVYNTNHKLVQTTEIIPNYIYDIQNIYKVLYNGTFWNLEPHYTWEQDYGTFINLTKNRIEKVTTKQTSYDENQNGLTMISEKVFDEESNNLKYEKTTYADGTVTEGFYKYAKDKGNTKLVSANINSIPLEVTHKTNGVTLGKIEMEFNHPDNVFPSKISKYGLNNVLNTQETNVLYDEFGNVLQSNSKTGLPTTYIYGYNGTLLIAEIIGATYTEVMQAFALPSDKNAYKNLDIYTSSNQDIDESSELILQQKLDQFRLKSNFKDYLITTYTYDPLIGIRSLTTPSGNKEFYHYDNANRLIRVEDINRNILKEYKYSYNTQP